jgi:DNA-binding transcriptional LysR family regulator
MRRDVRALVCFMAVAEELHFGRAAARLHLSQPSVSRAITELEASLGVQLLVRTNRTVRLTEAGQALLEDAPAAIQGVERCFERARRIGSGELGRLTVGFLPSVTARLLPPAITEFQAAYPGTKLELRELQHGSLRRALESGSVDVAILRSRLEAPGFESERLYDDPIDAVLPRDHTCADRSFVRFADLRDDNFVLWPRGQSPAGYDQVIVGCRAAGFEPRITQECVLPNTMLGLVAAGAGVSVISSLFRTFRSDVTFIPLADHPPGSIYVAWRAAPPSVPREALVRLIKQARSQIGEAAA